MTQIPYVTTTKLLDATEFMNVKFGAAFNGMITLNFDQLGITDPSDAKRALTRMNEFLSRKIADFADRYNEPFQHHFLYAHEKCARHGWHVHQAIVVPRALHRQLGPWLKGWKLRAFGSDTSNAAIHLRVRFDRTTEDIADRQARIVRYRLKTTATALVPDRGDRAADFHDLVGFRVVRKSADLRIPRIAGCSQNISRKAQVQHGFEQTMIWEDILSSRHLHEFHSKLIADSAEEDIRRLDI